MTTRQSEAKPQAQLTVDKDEAAIFVLALSDYGFKRKESLVPEALERLKNLQDRVDKTYIDLMGRSE